MSALPDSPQPIPQVNHRPKGARKIPWGDVRKDYFTGNYTLPALASKWNISLNTISKASQREGWNSTLTLKEEKAVKTAIQRAALKITGPAERLIERTITESQGWLDHVAQMKAEGKFADPDGLVKGVGAWKSVVGVARVAHGLGDESGTKVQVNVNALRSADVRDVVDVESETNG